MIKNSQSGANKFVVTQDLEIVLDFRHNKTSTNG
jgi:hypothetical protein